ncbi:hypothetical protein IWZ00DRAFT_244957 [Phyllosticta capitalensis]|uniref:Uncharacterized protein n=1 Tax=Phyllosticta capitalensis TaxID=121624 RepID=A0ABR1YW56_9PEZI
MPISISTSNPYDFASSFNSDRSPEKPRRRRRSPSRGPSNALNDGRLVAHARPVVAGGNGNMPQARSGQQKSYDFLGPWGLGLVIISWHIFLFVMFHISAHWYVGVPRNTFVPSTANGDYNWVEYLPYAYGSHFRQPLDRLTPNDRYMRAAWRVFDLDMVNVKWADPLKLQPTPEESEGCFLLVNQSKTRLLEIWDPRRGLNWWEPRPKNAEFQETVLYFSVEQLSVVHNILKYAYRDALFLCMTPEKKAQYMYNYNASVEPSPDHYFEILAERQGPNGRLYLESLTNMWRERNESAVEDAAK